MRKLHDREKNILFRGLYAVQVGYMDVQEGCILFSGVIYCSGGLYAVQEGYMMKKIIMILVASNVVASRPPEHRPTGTPHARAKSTR